MGRPATGEAGRFEKISIDGITVWRSNSVHPASPDRPIRIDVRGWLFPRKGLVVHDAC
jgi:hypothetical protein